MPQDLDISLHHRPDGTVYARLSGELDYGSGGHALARLSDAVRAGHTLLLVDLEHLYFCDSYGLACLLGLRNFAAGRGARIRLVNVSRQPLRVLRTTGTYELLTGPAPDLVDVVEESARDTVHDASA
ncbi:STAS domain-containing protein [Streptomyces capparidis]